MNHRDLNRIYYIRREIRTLENRLRELRQASLTGAKLDGMPKAGGGDKVADTAVKIADLEKVVDSLRLQLIDSETEIMKYISTIDDSYIRQIIYCRHIGLMSWTKTAHEIGGGNTAEGCRKTYARWMKKQSGRHPKTKRLTMQDTTLLGR